MDRLDSVAKIHCIICNSLFYCKGCQITIPDSCHCIECSIKLGHGNWVRECGKMTELEAIAYLI
jgi:hypothetical protein